jgi:hypothetical protein
MGVRPWVGHMFSQQHKVRYRFNSFPSLVPIRDILCFFYVYPKEKGQAQSQDLDPWYQPCWLSHLYHSLRARLHDEEAKAAHWSTHCGETAPEGSMGVFGKLWRL